MISQPIEIVLASESPRRKKILEDAGFHFTVFPVQVSEYVDKNLNIDAAIMEIAKKKAEAAFVLLKPLKEKEFLIVSADTMVIFQGKAIGKPENKEMAEQILSQLSGQMHEVKTAVCLLRSDKKVVIGLETSRVFFRPILRQEILDYIATEEPMDKAGAYAIQGGANQFVSRFEGEFDNIVGLPLQLFKKLYVEINER